MATVFFCIARHNDFFQLHVFFRTLDHRGVAINNSNYYFFFHQEKQKIRGLCNEDDKKDIIEL